ncbi:putative secreted protein [Corynebacterium halotolerans YIM 70093 = DSM 44683]|uniref:Putative secreted protein n=1 Tax=Corynebacterium halotolerans YIM 70093 = DSM 44683 TaxID=1121362 RepID=M1P1B1_9CORY|nr:putative secreted protein [Corynebacterium halotolerans YIM 70093 = DSM 44683]
MIVGLLALAGIAWGVDYALNKDNVPRGTSIGGVDIGGMSPDEAVSALERELGGVVDEPVTVRAGELSTEFVPAAAGLTLDFEQAVAAVGTQPANPFTRLANLVRTTEAEVATGVDQALLTPELERMHGELTPEPADGAVTLVDGAVEVTQPVNGQNVDPAALEEDVTSRWLDPTGVEVDAEITEPAIGTDAVEAAEDTATTVVSTPLVVHGRDEVDGVIEPARMGEVVTFVPEGDQLRTDINVEVAQGILAETLGTTESQRQNAQITFTDGGRQITPHVDGVQINWEATLADFPERVTSGNEDDRTWEAAYEDDPAAFTTEMAQTATFDEVVGEFTTSGYSETSGINIALTAAEVDGAIVAPGETFSLNGYTGPRGTAQGYVEGGIIINGRAGEAVGGGISQFATTLYNAAYFAGLEDVAHTPHSYYISRYPAGREATVYEGAIDLQFRNNTEYPVRIDTAVGGGNVTVRLMGVDTTDVESVSGGRWAHTQPETRVISGDDCIPSGGAPGFTTSDTRIIRDLNGNEISRETQTTVYDPQPIVRCS